MITIHDKTGKVVRASKNLRGITDRNRKDAATKVEVRARTCGAWLYVRWGNGDWTATVFESYDIAADFARNKRFASAEVTVHPL